MGSSTASSHVPQMPTPTSSLCQLLILDPMNTNIWVGSSVAICRKQNLTSDAFFYSKEFEDLTYIILSNYQ